MNDPPYALHMGGAKEKKDKPISSANQTYQDS